MGAPHRTEQRHQIFSGNGVSVAAMCVESSPPNVAYLLSRTARLSPVKKARTGGWEAKSHLLGVVPSPSFTVRRAFMS